MKPTKEDRKIALSVLRYYAKQADKLAQETEQEKPGEWSFSLDVTLKLFARGKDPDEIFDSYAKEYKLSHKSG